MTYIDDHVRLLFGEVGTSVDISCVKLGLKWPPPEEITVKGQKFKQTRRSRITDEERATMTHVVRGAEYAFVHDD